MSLHTAHKLRPYIVVMGNGHARARFCPPARYKSNARPARCQKNLNGQMPAMPVATFTMPGQPAGRNGHEWNSKIQPIQQV